MSAGDGIVNVAVQRNLQFARCNASLQTTLDVRAVSQIAHRNSLNSVRPTAIVAPIQTSTPLSDNVDDSTLHVPTGPAR